MGMNRLLSAVLAFLLVVAGCVDLNDFRPPTFYPASNTVVLDWTGGDNPLWAGGDLPPLDLAEFPLAWPWRGHTLADVSDFKERVRVEVESVLTASGVYVTIEEGEQRPMVSVVHFSPVLDPNNADSLGRGHLDTCNISDQDFSIVYAAYLFETRRLAADEWVRVFANVAAHEIAHNLGFEHVDPDDVPDSEFTELMLASQTILQRMREQRILVEQDTCIEIAVMAKAVTDLDRDGRPTCRSEKEQRK